MQFLKCYEERNETRTENRGQKDVKGKKERPGNVFGKRISHKGTQYHMQERTQHGAHQGNLVCLPDACIIKYLGIVLQREFSG